MAYVPPNPVPPTTLDQSLGLISINQTTPLTVNALLGDRVVFFSCFPDNPEVKFYFLNSSATWLWGDGSSSIGSVISHTYAKEGFYNIQAIIDLSFRGGSTVRMLADCLIEVPLSKPEAQLSATNLPPMITGTGGTPLQTLKFQVVNSGGQDVVLKPYPKKMSGTIDNMTFIKFTPSDSSVPTKSVPVEFQLDADWTKAPVKQTLTFEVGFQAGAIREAWNLTYRSGTVNAA